MKLTCLLGSGVSIPAGIPTVGDITNAVLSGDGIIDRTDGVSDEKQEDGRKRLILLAWLKAQAASRYSEIPERSVNYEDLAHLADQIADDIGYDYENPAVHTFVCKALTELEGLFRNRTADDSREMLRKLAETTVDYIRWIVIGMLAPKPAESDTHYLQFFSDACNEDGVVQIDLFSLNHDTLVERFLVEHLDHKKFSVANGFCEASSGDGSSRWDPSVYDAQKRDGIRVNVFKLHGTIDWITWEPIGGTQQEKFENRFIGTYEHGTSKAPKFRKTGTPLILVGTFNKILRYNSQPFLELHYRFMRALEEKDRTTLIVCGYGFGDKGVNTRIVEWLRRSPSNRLLIIDPEQSEILHNKARGGIQQVTNLILNAKEPAKNPTPLEAYAHEKWLGSFLTKHLQRTFGKCPEGNIREVAWDEVRRRIIGSDAEFLSAGD